MASIHLGDIGTVFEITITDAAGAVLDISAASVKQIILKKPDNSSLTKTAEFSTDGSDGKIRYLSIAGDIDQPRGWKIQGRVTLPGGSWSSEIGAFTVEKNL